jgi:monoamine oxidase
LAFPDLLPGRRAARLGIRDFSLSEPGHDTAASKLANAVQRELPGIRIGASAPDGTSGPAGVDGGRPAPWNEICMEICIASGWASIGGRGDTRAVEAYDVLIVGAGAAGLAAAATLCRGERSVCIVEARERVGGRIRTTLLPELGLPIELGAEFIHGSAPATSEWLRRANASVVAASGTRWTVRDGVLETGDALLSALRRGLAQAAAPEPDIPFGDYLRGPAQGVLSPEARELALMLVEGFDAADPARASTQDLLAEWAAGTGADAGTVRPAGGYGPLLHALTGALDTRCARLLLETPVRELHWRRGHVTAVVERFGRRRRIEAAQAVVTLPLGVLQAQGAPGAVRFEPALQVKRHALTGLGFGPAIKLLMHFAEPFWQRNGNDRLSSAAFFHSPGAPFPTFWTPWPARAPLLTAWAAGPRAASLAGVSKADLVQQALASLATVFPGEQGELADALRAVHWHDWQGDLFARGAYSYVNAGGVSARAALAAPVEATLFFAGEAADTGDGSGTVEGALQSGVRAAREITSGARRCGPTSI